MKQPYSFTSEDRQEFSLEVREDSDDVEGVRDLEKLNVLQQTILFQKDFVLSNKYNGTLFS